MKFTINRTLFIEKLEKANATVDVKGFHNISCDGFLQDFKQIYECYQALQNVGKQENNIKINM
jgi:hypothetical protein